MLAQSQENLQKLLEKKLYGTRGSAFLSELLTNSGYFFILKSLSDIVFIGWYRYLTDSTEYLLLVAMLVQTWYLSRPKTHRFWGNIVGVFIYTIIDLFIEKLDFLDDLNHLVFWIFSLVIAILQGFRYHWLTKALYLFIPLESLARTLMILAFFISIGLQYHHPSNYWQEISNFSSVTTQKFLIWSMLFLGILLGLQHLQIVIQQKRLQTTAEILRNLAEWGMGTHVVNTAVNNIDNLNFKRCDRTILFMDIRGFTAWCERTPSDIVANILNDYYRHVEPEAAKYQPLRITFTADEIMAIYATPEQGVSAAISMQKIASEILKSQGIGAGCAVHCGSVIEGLFGSKDVRTYTVIGDVVNTAKRLEGATPAGKITISDQLYQRVQYLTVESCEPITAKGKTESLIAWRIGE